MTGWATGGLRTLRDLVERNAALHADDLHLVFGDTRHTFRQFAERSLKLASALQQLGLRSQDRVAMLAMNCSEFLEVYGMAEVSPYIIVPVNFRLALPETLRILLDSKPRILIFEAQYAVLIEQLRPELDSVEHFIVIGATATAQVMCYEEVLASGTPSGVPSPLASDIHALVYTSGTTGRPKGAMLSHAGVLAIFAAWASQLDADVGDKILLSMPFFHIGARSQGGALSYRGGTMIVHRSFDALEIVRTVVRERVTQLHLAPTLMQQVLDLPDLDRHDMTSLRTINYAAAPMPLTTLKRAMNRFGRILINGYGQTEGGSLSLRKNYHRPQGTTRDLERLTSVGQPLPDTITRIVDDQDAEVPAGQVGELCVRSPQNMVGYWNNSVATIEAMRDGWLHTGDMARRDADGFVYLVDRKKDMIVSGGENVYSREVEEALMAHPSVADVAVIGIPDAKWGEAVHAVVVLRPGAMATDAELIAHCRPLIAGYKCPKGISFTAELPRVPSGKINKVALRDRYG